ncbi:unnamed protein product [Prunus armeniaca]
MGHRTLRPRGDLTTASSAVSFTAFGVGLQRRGRKAERILPLQLSFCFQEGEMLDETVGVRAERMSPQSAYNRDLLGTNSSLALSPCVPSSSLQNDCHKFPRVVLSGSTPPRMGLGNVDRELKKTS